MAIRACGATLMKMRQPPKLLPWGLFEGLTISPEGPKRCTSQSAEKSRWTGRWGPSRVLGAPRKTTNAGGQASSQLGSSDGGRYGGVVKIKPTEAAAEPHLHHALSCDPRRRLSVL